MREIYSNINIVGGGLIGLATAFSLSQHDLRITILEKRPKYDPKKSYYDISTIELNRVTHNNNKFKYLRDDINKIIVNRYLIDENEFIDNNIQSKIYE